MSASTSSALESGCLTCRDAAVDPFARRFRYPFARCAGCASERERAELDRFAPCPACQAEGADPSTPRRCHRCGPGARLTRADGRAFDPTRFTMLDEVDAAGGLLASRERVLIVDLAIRLELDGGETRPDGEGWYALTPELAPATPLFDLALRRLRRAPWARVAPEGSSSTATWRLAPAASADAEQASTLAPASRAEGEDLRRLVLDLREPRRGLTYGAQLLLAVPGAGAARAGALKPVATVPGAPALELLRAHLLAEMTRAELDLCFGEAEVLGALRPGWEAGPPEEEATLRSSLAELAAAAAAAIDPASRARPADPARPLEALYALTHPAALEEAERFEHYPTGVPKLGGRGLPYFEPLSAWRALLGDLCAGEAPERIAARFIIAALDGLDRLVGQADLALVTLSGPAFAQDDFRDRLERRLRARGRDVRLEAPREAPGCA